MKRRDFLRAATGGAGVAGAAGAAQAAGSPGVASLAANNTTTTAGNESGNQTTSGGGELPGSGTTKTVELVDYAYKGATKSPLYIKPGTTVNFVWKTSTHNINVAEKPEGSSWKGVPKVHDKGYSHTHTFTTKGKYHFWCDPHKSLGMVGDIVVNDSGQPPGGAEAEKKLSPHEMGVPFQAQYVGLATVLMMFVSLAFTFFVLKYGSSPHTSAPNKRD